MNKTRAGFTLVEVAIAIVVVALGILAVFALLSAGMDASRKALTETHAAMFADSVFNGMRARSLRAAEQGQWESFWNEFINSTRLPSGVSWKTNILVAAPGAWLNTGALAVSNGGIYTCVYKNDPFHDPSVSGVEDHALRYRCNASSIYPLTVKWTNKVLVTLQVWDGEFGSTSNEDALVFYSEFYNQGDL